jgi:hypothetical protein
VGEPLVNVEFRDGERLVPHHVGVLMKGLETHTMTYDQAIRAANQALMKNRLAAAQKSLINQHFRENR